MTIIFVINLFSSLFLCGLIWLVQMVHYPIFHRLDKSEFISHMEFHQRRISYIVVPVMITELVTSCVLSFYSDTFQLWHTSGLVVVILIWLNTFFYLVPLHRRLMNGYNTSAVNELCSRNGVRTFLWSVKSCISLYILFLWI